MQERNDQRPASYNMKAVVRETGLKADTLRAWERRYGLPEPARTEGGHRLYTQRDVETFKWLASRQEEGLSISRAVDLWHSLVKDGQDPLQSMPYAHAPALAPAAGARIEALRQEWLAACQQFDEAIADQILTHAFALYPPETVLIQILMQGLAEIGEQWYQDQVTVQQEHFTSELAIRRVHAMLSATPGPNLPGRILTLCPPGEEHTFSALLMTYLLRRAGRQAHFLGANVPLQRLEQALSSTRPSLVILIAQQLQTAASALSLAYLVQEKRIPLAFAGRIFNRMPEIHRRIPGHFIGENIHEAPAAVEALLNHPQPLPAIPPVSAEARHAHIGFYEHQPQIEATIWRAFLEGDIPEEFLNTAIRFLSESILAALSLGQITLLKDQLVWIEGYARNHDYPDEILGELLEQYTQAIEEALPQNAGMITAVLKQNLLHSSLGKLRDTSM